MLIDVFDLSTSNATDGDITVCVDTGADMLCLTSTKNTRVLQWSPDIVVRVANSDVVPVDALVETIIHFPVSGRKAVLRRGLVSSKFRKVLLSGPALAEVGIETRTARGPKFGGFLEWADGGLEPFQGPPYKMVVKFTAPGASDTAEVLAGTVLNDAKVLLPGTSASATLAIRHLLSSTARPRARRSPSPSRYLMSANTAWPTKLYAGTWPRMASRRRASGSSLT